MTAAARYPCLSRLGCDRLLNGELPDELAARAHIATCRDCEARLAEHVGEREAFAVPLPRAAVARLRRPATPLAPMAMIAALAAVVVGVFVLRPRPDAVTREKGRPTIGFFVEHAGAVRSGAAGEVVAPGDAIEFTASTERGGWLAIVSIDAAKKTSVYYPDASAAAPIAPGRDQVLPLSVVLDEVIGREWIYGVFCDEPFGVDAAKRIAIDGAPLPAGCIVDSLNIEKSPIR
jgi:hypothetical protein